MRSKIKQTKIKCSLPIVIVKQYAGTISLLAFQNDPGLARSLRSIPLNRLCKNYRVAKVAGLAELADLGG